MPRDSAPPFEEGQLVETKSFITGFRGAWFRCKITEISWRKNRVGHVLDYLDFPDERKKWIESYQSPPSPDASSKKRRERVGSHKKEVEPERQLMLRPVYPPIYRKDELIPTCASSEMRVVVEGGWRVGDLVDWLTDGCYWSGKLTQILNKKKAMVELLPQPLGEGQSYVAIMSDLRPTLIWSEESGWTVPTPEGATDFHQRVQIIHPEKQTVGDELAASEKPIPCEILIERPVTTGSPGADSVQASPQVDDGMETEPESLTNALANTPETITKTPKNIEVPVMSDKMKTHENVKVPLMSDKIKAPKNADVPLMPDKITAPKSADVPLISDKVKTPRNADVSRMSDKIKTPENSEVPMMSDNIIKIPENAKVRLMSDEIKTPESAEVPLMPDKEDTMLDALMGLEEVANKLTWLKQILMHGYPLPDAASSSPWEFVEHRSPPTS